MNQTMLINFKQKQKKTISFDKSSLQKNLRRLVIK
jgi:hypothetical protein